MKKSLIALAALAATSAFAQSSVTLYGIVEATVDVGYNRQQQSVVTTVGTNANGTANATSPAFVAPTYVNNVLTLGAVVNSGNVVTRAEQKNGMRIQDGSDQGTGTSRVGFRGTEDLGGGMKANFQLEMGLRIDDGAVTLPNVANTNSADSGGNVFGRNAWGGLSGGFGEVRLGRQVLGSFGVQANSWSAGSSNGLYDAGSGTAPLMGGVRFSNAIRYISPKMGGFTGSLMLAAPETQGDTSTSAVTTTTPPTPAVGTVNSVSTNAARRTGIDLALEYANGPAYVGFGYNVRDAANTSSGVTGITNAANNGANLANSANPGKVTAWTLGGSYDLGVVKPFINYTRQNTKTDRTDTLTPVASPTPTTALNFIGASNLSNVNESNVRAWSIGLRAPVGAFTIITGYGIARTSGVQTIVGNQNTFALGTQTGIIRAANEQRRSAFQLGMQYALSKRTLVEANYGFNRLENNTDATATNNFNATSGVQTTRATDRVSALNVGLKHSF